MPSWKSISNWEAVQHHSGRELGIALYDRLRDLQQAYSDGNVLALFEACTLCDKNEMPLPGWITQEAMQLLATALTSGLSRQRGRAMSPLSRLKENLKHYLRWDTVKSLVEHRSAGWKDYQDLLYSPNLKPDDRERLEAYPPFDPGKNLEETFIQASKALQRSFAFGSPDTIRKSYQRMERLSRDPEQSSTFISLSESTYREFGLSQAIPPPPPSAQPSRVKK